MELTRTKELINHELTSFTFQEDSISAVPVEVDVPKEWLLERPFANLGGVFSYLAREMPRVEALALAAYAYNDRFAWSIIQNILYIWNVKQIFRLDTVDSYKYLAYSVLRRKIVDTQLKHRPIFTLECEKNFTPEKAVNELYERAMSHRINSHPFLAELQKNGIPLNQVRLFLNNYYVNNRLFHLFIAAQSLSTPMEMRTELYTNLDDELGQGDNAFAHPTLFLKNFNTIGKPKLIKPLPEALFLANCKFTSTFLSDCYQTGLGGFGFIELTMPNQMLKIYEGLKKSGLPEQDLDFWQIHITVDIEHGEAWFGEMAELIKTPQHANLCLNGGMLLLEARATMYDGFLRALDE